MKIKITESQFKKIFEDIELPESPAIRFYKILLSSGYITKNTPVDVGLDTLDIYLLPEPAPHDYFTESGGYLIVVVPYLFEEEGVEIQFESEDESYYEELYREDLKRFISNNWTFDFPLDFDDEYLY